jgi:hypothetical protein
MQELAWSRLLPRSRQSARHPSDVAEAGNGSSPGSDREDP